MSLFPPPAPSQEGNDFLIEGTSAFAKAKSDSPSGSAGMHSLQGAGDGVAQKGFAMADSPSGSAGMHSLQGAGDAVAQKGFAMADSLSGSAGMHSLQGAGDAVAQKGFAMADSPLGSSEAYFLQGSGDGSPQIDFSSAMAVAIAEAREGMSAGHGGPFGAVVLKGATIVGRGHNRVLSSHDPTAHAEVTALRDAAQNLGTHVLSDCVLVTTCEPCPMCFSAAFWSRVDGIVYAATRHEAAAVGFDDAKLYDILSGSAVGVSPLIKIHVPEALDLFNQWTLSDRKELY